MTNLAPMSRLKGNERPNTKTPGFVLNKTDDLNNIIVMRGSAKRRRLETEEKPNNGFKINQEDFKEGFLKLRAPSFKSHQKQVQNEGRIMTKSCELLLECIKPYKEIHVAKRTQVTESKRTIGSILTTDVVYETKATRKVQFVSFCEENPLQSVFSYKRKPSTTTENSLHDNPNNNEPTTNFPQAEDKQLKTGKTVSSEDFITRVFTDPDALFI